ncbi:GTPase [Nitzschia inconspicua]|uniref:GTPase n=1 Tax=Nitzschia inconspicua TaxID=303405 RepID=A0A9K3L5X4_9STRA|nr:GTPase [Nitzschia inconspicua]
MRLSTTTTPIVRFAMVLQALGWLVSTSRGFVICKHGRKPVPALAFATCCPQLQQLRRHLHSPPPHLHHVMKTHVPRPTRQPYSSTRWASTQVDEDQTNRGTNKKKSKPPSIASTNKKGKGTQGKVPKKIVVNEITPDKIEKLAAAFDDLARKDGFDSTMSRMANDATFEEDFSEDGFLDDDDEEFVDIDLDDDEDDDDEDFLDFGGNSDDDDMEARLAQAKRDMVRGQVSIPVELDRFAGGADEDDLKRLGFEKEENFFGDDETRRKDPATLISNAMTCSACGSDFQSRDEMKPGFIPKEKFDQQVKLSKIEEMQRLKSKAESLEWSPEDEIEYLIQTQGKGELDKNNEPSDATDIDIDAIAEEMGLDLAKVATKKVICKRCHGLQNFGKVDTSLRPGWTDEPTMSQEQFRELLRPIAEKPAVVVALVDLFDFSGSVLRELDGIAGQNPVILAANKADLLPSQMGKQRVENWVRRELEYMGVRSIANIGGAVRLVSCKTGEGISDLMKKARELAEEVDGDVYVVGAANAGKSTLINFILSRDQEKPTGKIRAGNRNQFKGALTTSPLPGTTLKFIKIDLGEGRNLYDTPGLLVPGTITQLLTPEELKIVCPKKKVEPITFRVASGKCVLVGGLAKIEVVGDSRPFMFTFFVANEIKLHPTDSNKADEFRQKHAGGMLTPPLEPGVERLEELGQFESHVVEIEGAGWKEAAADITLTGLGWVAVTGAGKVQVKISVPKGIGVSIRPPLMPFDVWEVAAKYTGGKAVRKSTKSKTGKRRSGVGRN